MCVCVCVCVCVYLLPPPFFFFLFLFWGGKRVYILTASGYWVKDAGRRSVAMREGDYHPGYCEANISFSDLFFVCFVLFCCCCCCCRFKTTIFQIVQSVLCYCCTQKKKWLCLHSRLWRRHNSRMRCSFFELSSLPSPPMSLCIFVRAQSSPINHSSLGGQWPRQQSLLGAWPNLPVNKSLCDSSCFAGAALTMVYLRVLITLPKVKDTPVWASEGGAYRTI